MASLQLAALCAAALLGSAAATQAPAASGYVRTDETWLVGGDHVQGVWQAGSALAPGAYVALFLRGASQPAWREVVCGSAGKCPTTGRFSTKNVWTAPASGKLTNVWEVRLYASASAGAADAVSQPLVSYPHAVVSTARTSLGPHSFAVGSYSQSVSKGDWIGLFFEYDPSSAKQESLWHYYPESGTEGGVFSTKNGATSPAWRTPSNGDAGPWEFRYVAASGEVLGRSRPMQFIDNVECRRGNKPGSKIEHVIVFITENHSWDNYYGAYCLAPAYSSPKCHFGRHCCERAPPSLGPYVKLTDKTNIAFDPNHSQLCELCEINGGKMDKFRKGCDFPGTVCSSPGNLAVAPYTGTSSDPLRYYYEWAKEGAIADRWFQNAAGASSENDIYLAYGRFIFTDNTHVPNSPTDVGTACEDPGHPGFGEPKTNYDEYHTIGDLLEFCKIKWGYFIEGYAASAANVSGTPCWPEGFDASDVGQSYAGSVQDKPGVYADSTALLAKIAMGELPAVSYVRALGIHSEHPGQDLLSSQLFTKQYIDLLKSSKYWDNTVVIVIPDESGGYFDHVSTPPPNPVDGQAYGVRTPFLAIGGPVKKNYISHLQMEMSSITRFIERNWLANGVGQLKARDANVNGLSDIFDSSAGKIAP